MIGKVYLVGAGCGDPELITWKGLNLLRKCVITPLNTIKRISMITVNILHQFLSIN